MCNRMEWLQEFVNKKNIHSLHGSIDYFHSLVKKEIEESKDPFDIMDLSSYLILMTGKVADQDMKKGWVLQIHGCSDSSDINHSDWVVSLVKNLDSSYPGGLSLGECVSVSSMSNYRKEGYPIIDRMSFDRSSFLILNTTKCLIRLQPYLSILYLPQRDFTGLYSWRFILGLEPEKSSRRTNCLFKRRRRYKKHGESRILQGMLNRLVFSYSKHSKDYKTCIQSLSNDIITSLQRMEHQYNKCIGYRDEMVTTSLIVCPEEQESYLHGVDEFRMTQGVHYIPDDINYFKTYIDPLLDPEHIQYF